MDKKIISQKIKSFENLSDTQGYYGYYWGDKIPSKKLSNALKTHGLNDYVFFLRDQTFFGSAENSILITDEGLSYRYDEDPIFIFWESMYDFEILRCEETNIIVIEFEGKSLYISLGDTENALPSNFIDLLDELAEENNSFIDDSEASFQDLPGTEMVLGDLNDINISNDSLLEIIDRCDYFINSCKLTHLESKYDVTINPYTIHLFSESRSKAFYLLGEFEQAKDELLFLISKIRDFINNEDYKAEKDGLKECLAFDLEFIAKVDQHYENYKDAIVYLSEANSLNVGGEQQRRIRSSLKNTQEQLCKSLITDTRNARQVVLCTQQTPSQTIKEFLFVSTDTLKSTGWKFPVGHPINNTLYVCHPLRPNQYFLMEDFHEKCFDDKYAELVYLLESLGANYIHVDVASGFNSSSVSKIDQGINASLNLPIRDASVKKDTNVEDDKSQQVQRTGSWEVSLTPHGLPYIPEDLAWFHHEPIWQRLAQSCIKGNCKEFTINLNQQEDFSINSTRFHNIEIELDIFVKKLGSIKIFHREKAEKSERKIKNTAWKIVAKFSQPVYVSCVPYSANEELLA